jgi:hypothetical protein
LKYYELTLYLSPALIEVLYYPEITYFNYLYLTDYLYRFLEPINSFVATTPIGGDDGILKYHELNLYHLSNLGRILYHPEITYLILPFISKLQPTDEP